MANWRAVTEADISTRLSGKELIAYRNAALGPGEVDPIASLITTVTNKVRGYIAGNPDNALGPVGTLPESLIDTTLALLVIRVMSRCYGEILDPSGQRKTDGESAEAVLKLIAAGDGPAIEAPDTGAIENPKAAMPFEYSWDHEETFRRDQQEGT
jgi:hypothetical protein